MSEAQIPSLVLSPNAKYAPNRACEHCRALKVRCIPVDNSLSSSCERCFKAGTECVHLLRTRRKPRSRNDAKIMQLETELRALSSMVRYQQQQGRHDSLGSSAGPIQSIEIQTDTKPNATSTSPDRVVSSPSQSVSSSGLSHLDTDIIGRGVLSEDTAQMYLAQFISGLLPNHPFLNPDHLNLNDLRSTTPLLLLATLASGSSVFDPDKCREIYTELTTVLMERIVLKGSKTLDTLQALLIAISWHYPPDGYDAIKYIQYVHLAAGIVSELRTQRKDPAPESFKTYREADRRPSASREHSGMSVLSNENPLERERTLLASYGVCLRVCVGNHLPTPLPFGGWVQDCIDRIEASRSYIESDAALVGLVKLSKIMEESVKSLGVDDISSRVDISVPRQQLILKRCERQLNAWRQSLTFTPMPSTEIIYHGNRACLHEVALYIDHDPEDFRPPYTLERPKRNHSERPELNLGHVDSTFVCLSASQAALDVFLQIDIESLRACPDWVFIIVMYSMILLVRLYMSVNETTSPFAGLLDRQTLNLPYYFYHVTSQLDLAAADGKCRMASKFTIIMQNIQKWLVKQYGPLEEDQSLNIETENRLDMVSSNTPEQLLFANVSGKERLLNFPDMSGSGQALQDALQDFDCSFPMQDVSLPIMDMDVDWDLDENVLALFQEIRASNPSLLADSRD